MHKEKTGQAQSSALNFYTDNNSFLSPCQNELKAEYKFQRDCKHRVTTLAKFKAEEQKYISICRAERGKWMQK